MMPRTNGPYSPGISRRRMLGTAANGFGLLGLAGLMAEAQARDASRGAEPLGQPAGREACAPPRRGPSGPSSCS